MKLPLGIAQKLMLLYQGEKIPASSLKHPLIEQMISDGILYQQIQGRSKKVLFLPLATTLAAYLQNRYGISDLGSYIVVLQKEDLSRAEAIEVSANSKLKGIRTFKGFLVNCYQPLKVILKDRPFTLDPIEGVFTFIHDYETFEIPSGVTVVGIENPENFRHIHKQRFLFQHLQVLFVSRYPQSKDLIKWLSRIVNNYLHFGDFDLAGINIFVHEYKKALGNRAHLFIPSNVEELLVKYGNRDLYNNQIHLYSSIKHIDDEQIINLIKLIHFHKKGLEQEIFIKL